MFLLHLLCCSFRTQLHQCFNKDRAHLHKHGRCSSMAAKYCMWMIKYPKHESSICAPEKSLIPFHPKSNNLSALTLFKEVLELFRPPLHFRHSVLLFFFLFVCFLKGYPFGFTLMCFLSAELSESKEPKWRHSEQLSLDVCLPVTPWLGIDQLQLAQTVHSHALHPIPRDDFIVHPRNN